MAASVDRLAASTEVLDARQRKLFDLRISVTDNCNMRCTYCMPAEIFGLNYKFLEHNKLLSFEEIARVAKLSYQLGVRTFKITGGEPLTRPFIHHLVGLIREVAPEATIALITNGLLLESLAQRLKDAGLDRLTVSLDTLDAARFATISGRGHHLEQVIAGIAAARKAGFKPIKINMVVMRGSNDDEVLSMAEYFRNTGDILRFIEFMDVGTLNDWQSTKVVPSSEILARLMQIGNLEAQHPARAGETAKRYTWSDGSGELGFISSISQPFCGNCTRLRLSADGQVYNCLFAKKGWDLRKLLRDSSIEDGQVSRLLSQHWRLRDDHYSAERAQQKQADKVEMFYIGG